MTNIADRIVVWAATVVVFTASGSFKWAASPREARPTELKDTAASGADSALRIFITLCRWLDRRWRRWSGFRRIWSCFYWI